MENLSDEELIQTLIGINKMEKELQDTINLIVSDPGNTGNYHPLEFYSNELEEALLVAKMIKTTLAMAKN